MFFGAALKPGVVCTPNELDGGNVLHLSQACLVNPTSSEKTYLQVTHDGKTYSLCALQKDKTENVTLDLFVSTASDVKFQTHGGKNEVHIIGYFEPNDDDESDMEDGDEEAMMRRLAAARGMGEDDSDSDDEEGEGEEESEDEKAHSAAMNKAMKALVQAKMMEKIGKGGDSSDDEDDEDDDEEGGDSDEESSSEESSPVAPTPPQPEKKQKATPKQTPPPVEATNSKKRKAEEPAKGSAKGTKQQKTEKSVKTETSSSDSSPEGQWEKAIVEYLTKNGRQAISSLAGKVKRPDSLKSTKYTAFLKSRPSVFALDGQNVTLKA